MTMFTLCTLFGFLSIIKTVVTKVTEIIKMKLKIRCSEIFKTIEARLLKLGIREEVTEFTLCSSFFLF